jgi:hypothetical protein
VNRTDSRRAIEVITVTLVLAAEQSARLTRNVEIVEK